jgi:hypothetical protein
MSKRLITLLTALLVLGFVVAGCGDDESDSAGNGDTTAAETVTGAETVTDDATATDEVTETDSTTRDDTATSEETETAEGGGAAAPTSRARTRENCEKGINSAQQLDPDAKEKLLALCGKATSDDPDDVREAAREFCEVAVDNMPPGAGQSRDEALKSCEQAGRQAAERAGEK